MTLYFTSTTPFDTPFTVSLANADTLLPANHQWAMSLRSELAHTGIALQQESNIALDITVAETNDRYTTFRFSNNLAWQTMRDNLKDSICVFQIGYYDTLTSGRPFTPIMDGVAKVITKAGEDPNKNIVSYTSTNEDNSGFVYYSENL